MLIKKDARQRRARRARLKIRELGMPRLTVHRTPQHIYAQVVAEDGATILVAACSLEKDIKKATAKEKGKLAVATAVGKAVATRAQEKGIKKIAFDRAGFKYHGRIKALADGARENGLLF